MFSSIRGTLGGLFRSTTSVASSSRVTLPPSIPSFGLQARFRSHLAPRKVKYRKSQKGRPSGGSIKGTTLKHGGFGIRLTEAVRLTAAQLSAAQISLKRKIKPVKGATVYMRVFPDVPVCVKGNETRMGKGKGSFEYWACRVPAGRVIFEIAGGNIKESVARQALKLAQVKMPVHTEFVTMQTPPRLGNIVSDDLAKPLQAQPTVATLDVLTPAQQAAKVEQSLDKVEVEKEAVAA